MGASLNRRYRRMEERNAKKLYDKITKETMAQIKLMPKEDQEKMLELHKAMVKEREQILKDKQNV
jgi:hypothetical protein